MKDLKRLVDICKADLDGLGIKYGNVYKWSVNTRAKSRLGQCMKIGNDLFDINISQSLLNDDIDDQIALNTIMHELLHTVSGCFNHSGRWKVYAQYINIKLPKYCIKRTANRNEMAVLSQQKQPNYKYILRCTNCKAEVKREKKSKVITNYKNYRCGKCSGRLERIL